MNIDTTITITVCNPFINKSKTPCYKQWLMMIMSGLIFIFFTGIHAAGTDEISIQTNRNAKIITKKGHHGGRLLSKGNITAEITLFERNMPPHFRVFLYQNNTLLSPKDTKLTITLKRFNGDKDTISFKPIDNFLQSIEVIKEPHSFDVEVKLFHSGKSYSWSYATYEGRVTIAPDIASAAGIEVAIARGELLRKKLAVFGKIIPNENTLAPIYPRFSGIIKSMKKNLGDSVEKGEILAAIESNESLQNYTISAPITGTIVKKLANIGAFTQSDKPIYEIANLDTVWADLTLYRKEASLIKKGMLVTITGDNGKPKFNTEISYISPLGIEDSQTTLARAVLPNKSRQWLPGMYVNAEIIFSQKSVAVALPHSALQHWRNWNVVFVKRGDQFEATPVSLGEQDDHWVEVLSGIKPGQTYVSENSFFLKADVGKAGASHDH